MGWLLSKMAIAQVAKSPSRQVSLPLVAPSVFHVFHVCVSGGERALCVSVHMMGARTYTYISIYTRAYGHRDCAQREKTGARVCL